MNLLPLWVFEIDHLFQWSMSRHKATRFYPFVSNQSRQEEQTKIFQLRNIDKLQNKDWVKVTGRNQRFEEQNKRKQTEKCRSDATYK